MPGVGELGPSSVYAGVLMKLCIFNNYLHLHMIPRHHSAGDNIDSHCTTALIYKGQDLVLAVHRTSNCHSNWDRLSDLNFRRYH